MTIDNKAVGKRIFLIRKNLGYSMEKFGELVDNAPKGAVNNWEKGTNLPNVKRLERIALLGNISHGELLYGSFCDFIKNIIETHFKIKVDNKFLMIILSLLKQANYTYNDEIEIIRMLNGLFTTNNIATQTKSIFYQPILAENPLFMGIVNTSSDSEVVCIAYSDTERNTLHLIPNFENAGVENAFFTDCINQLNIPQKHNYFTGGILILKMALVDSNIIYYHINKQDYLPQISSFKYDVPSDSYRADTTLEYQIHSTFYRLLEKECAYLKYKTEGF